MVGTLVDTKRGLVALAGDTHDSGAGSQAAHARSAQPPAGLRLAGRHRACRRASDAGARLRRGGASAVLPRRRSWCGARPPRGGAPRLAGREGIRRLRPLDGLADTDRLKVVVGDWILVLP